MTTSYEYAAALAAELTEAGVRATADPRSVNVPCVLVTIPVRTFDLMGDACTATWSLVALAPPPANADAWIVLDTLVDGLRELLPLTTARPAGYTLDDLGTVPAVVCEWEGILE